MPRFEFIEGTSQKFWEIELHGTAFTARWGRLGTQGQSKTQSFDDEDTAAAEYEKLVRSKEKKGYLLVVPALAGADEVERVVVRLDDGSPHWRELELRGQHLIQRTATPGGESAARFEAEDEAAEQFEFLISRYVKQGFKEVSRQSGLVSRIKEASEVTARLTEHPEYERACLAAPDDLRPWQIYADWLQERGDLRGELAALFLGKQRAVAWERIREQREALLGPCAEHDLVDLVFTNGFLTGATLKRGDFDSDTDLAALTRDFLSRPVARFVSELRFGLASHESNNDWTATLKAVLDAPQAPQVRKLEFDAYTYEDCEISWTPFGDFSGIWKGLPALEHLHVRAGGAGQLGRIEHARLETFIRESGGLAGAEIDAMVQAKWPALERLDVWTGSSQYGAEATTDQLGPILRGEGLPRLRHLGLVNSELSVELLEELASSPLLARLRVLDLSKGVLRDADVDLLLRLAPKFTHLLRFDLSSNLLDERLDELRRAIPNAVLEGQRNDYGDEDERYVAVGE